MSHRTLKTNILRNLRDQPLHALWAGTSMFAPFASHRWLDPWVTATVILLSFASIAFLVYREWDQYPPHDWWDFWLDTTFYGWGAIGGLVAGLLLNAGACACGN